jgi:hypothetical protein
MDTILLRVAQDDFIISVIVLDLVLIIKSKINL